MLVSTDHKGPYRAAIPHYGGRALLSLLQATWPFLLTLALWEAWVVLGRVPEIIAPSPWSTLQGLALEFRPILPDLLATLGVIAAGLAIGMSVGMTLAAATWFSPLVAGLVTPTTVLLNAIPSITLIPIVGSLVGYNGFAVVSIAALITFFPALVMTRSGLDAVPPGANNVMGVLGAGRWAVFRLVALPAAVPAMITALRIATMLSVLGALTGEWLLGTSGLGYRLALAQQTMDSPLAWRISLVGVLLSLVTFGLATMLERQVTERFR